MARRAYLNASSGQLHVRIWGDMEDEEQVILALPPSPYSGQAYRTLAPILAEKIPVISIDYPGYGNSDPVDNIPSIQTYANAVNDVIGALCSDKQIILLGFHTGCLVAIETGLLSDLAVEKSILIDVPFFNAERRADLKNKRLGRLDISETLDSILPAWEMSVARQVKMIPIERAFEMFVDQISGGDAAGAAFEAAFSYDCDAKMPAVNTPVVVIATSAGLYHESLQAAKAIKGSKLIQAQELKVSILEREASAISKYILAQVN